MTAADRLLDAGPRLARRLALRELTVEALCAEAGVSADALSVAYGDLPAYLLALQQRFMDRVRDRIVAVTSGVGPGLLRMQLATETYLGNCLAEHALRAWFVEARSLPAVADNLRRQNQIYAMVVGAELQALGWPEPQGAARLYLAMSNEAAVVEHRLGQPSPETRQALWDFLRQAGPR